MWTRGTQNEAKILSRFCNFGTLLGTKRNDTTDRKSNQLIHFWQNDVQNTASTVRVVVLVVEKRSHHKLPSSSHFYLFSTCCAIITCLLQKKIPQRNKQAMVVQNLKIIIRPKSKSKKYSSKVPVLKSNYSECY